MKLPEKIAALKESDEFTFRQIFNEFHQKTYYYILAKTKSPYLAEEVTQLTFIKLWNNRLKLNEDLSISIQLFQIAKTTCIDLLRKDRRRGQLVIAKNEPPSDNVTETLNIHELQFDLNREVEKMPPVRKKVFEMSRFEAKTYKEIAILLSISEKTVENHISLALKQLRRFLTLFFLFLLR